jgi:hypothetical protein
VPTIGNAHFAIDLQTLFAVLVFLSAIGGLLLLFCWIQNRNTPALAFWGRLPPWRGRGGTPGLGRIRKCVGDLHIERAAMRRLRRDVGRLTLV